MVAAHMVEVDLFLFLAEFVFLHGLRCLKELFNFILEAEVIETVQLHKLTGVFIHVHF